MRSLTKAVAVHCATLGYPVRCNSIHPGAFDTPMLDRLREHPEEASPLARTLFSPALLPPSLATAWSACVRSHWPNGDVRSRS